MIFFFHLHFLGIWIDNALIMDKWLIWLFHVNDLNMNKSFINSILFFSMFSRVSTVKKVLQSLISPFHKFKAF